MASFGSYVLKSAKSSARSRFFYIGLIVVIALVLAGQLGAYIQLEGFFRTSSNGGYLTIDTLINYGNGTSRWANKTHVPPSWNFYDLTANISKVEATYTSVLNEHFIQGIDGVRGSGRSYWTLWTFCDAGRGWAASPVGADLIRLKNRMVLAWYFQAPPTSDPSTWQPPVPSATKLSSCPR